MSRGYELGVGATPLGRASPDVLEPFGRRQRLRVVLERALEGTLAIRMRLTRRHGTDGVLSVFALVPSYELERPGP